MKKIAIFAVFTFLFALSFSFVRTTEVLGNPFEDKPINVTKTVGGGNEGFTMSTANGWKICDNCANKHTKCVYCSKQLTANTKVFPIVCKECREKEYCPICDHKLIYKNFSYHADKWDAYLCKDCAKAKQNGYKCVKCGKNVKNWGW